MYYLRSRYYDPKVGRFINADAFASTGQGVLGNNMFAYCGNNPVKYYDPSGTISYDAYSDDADLFERMLEGGAGGVIALGAVAGITYLANQKKPVNLPARRKVTIDIDHVISGHTPGGSRNPTGKKSVFVGLTTQQIVKAIYEAYSHSSKLKTQWHNIKLVGYSDTFDLVIEMWIDTILDVITTAYPKG